MRKFIKAVKVTLIAAVAFAGLNLALVGVAGAQPLTAAGGFDRVAGVNQSKQDACAGIRLAGGSCSSGGSGINSVLRTVLNLLSAIAGMIAVIMIIISGIKFTTSGGDAQKVASAKSALTYAIVGLVVVALSQIIVHFVISTV